MIRYEIREKNPLFGENWQVVSWFNDIEKAREYWSSTPFQGIEAALVKIQCTETYEHYHSADGKEAY